MGSEEDSDSDFVAEEDGNVVEGSPKKIKPAAAAKKKSAAAGSKRKRSEPKQQEDVDEAALVDDAIEPPSYARKTERGGYAHTNSSRLKISRANHGNTPWNKGKNRSVSAKAKISAGVRARNRAILLEKAAKLGLTEDQWEETMKKVKYIRERVRRAKRSNEQKDALLQAERERQAQDELDAPLLLREQSSDDESDQEEPNKSLLVEDTEEKPDESLFVGETEKPEANKPPSLASDKMPLDDYSLMQHSHQAKLVQADDAPPMPSLGPLGEGGVFESIAVELREKEKGQEHSTAREKEESQKEQSALETTREASTSLVGTHTLDPTQVAQAPGVTQTVHNESKEEDDEGSEEEEDNSFDPAQSIFAREYYWTPHPLGGDESSYSDTCHHGGPGGLICCEQCSASYSTLLTSTFRDIQDQKISKTANEAKELLGFLDQAKRRLKSTLAAARAKPLPNPRKGK